ncbi:MAG: hypothetical protein M0020_03715 [Actinomycetota bacterium]|nr:hypothetical protein [Actinomycetota bacterium]
MLDSALGIPTISEQTALDDLAGRVLAGLMREPHTYAANYSRRGNSNNIAEPALDDRS